MAEIKQTDRAAKALQETMACCKEYRHVFVMPEHLLFVLTDEFNFNRALNIFYPIDNFVERLEEKLEDVETIPEDKEYEPEASVQMGQVIEFACQQVVNSSAKALDLPHLVMGILHLEESWACYLLKKHLLACKGYHLLHLFRRFRVIILFLRHHLHLAKFFFELVGHFVDVAELAESPVKRWIVGEHEQQVFGHHELVSEFLTAFHSKVQRFCGALCLFHTSCHVYSFSGSTVRRSG